MASSTRTSRCIDLFCFWRWSAPQSPTINRGDGTPGTDADWAAFMNQVDLVKLGLWKPGYAYPSPGEWHLGIDNLGIRALP